MRVSFYSFHSVKFVRLFKLFQPPFKIGSAETVVSDFSFGSCTISLSDSIERFHIAAFLVSVLAQNILEAEGPWFGNFIYVSVHNSLVVINYVTSLFPCCS